MQRNTKNTNAKTNNKYECKKVLTLKKVVENFFINSKINLSACIYCAININNELNDAFAAVAKHQLMQLSVGISDIVLPESFLFVISSEVY